MPKSWYSFNCNIYPNSQYIAANYLRLSVKPLCTTGPNVCAIYVYYFGTTVP